MLQDYTIKDLYALALAEGEGVGTAYEYYVKRLALRPWLAGQKRPSSILIAGLPEKYGASLDFLLLAAELDTAVTVLDDRPAVLERARQALAAAQAHGWLQAVWPDFVLVEHMAAFEKINAHYDLVLSSELLQRLSPEERLFYVKRICEVGTAVALFTPNAGNPAHTNLSGLSGLYLHELSALVQHALAARYPQKMFASHFGVIDMPPFPPGITRSDEQREQATSGRFEAIVMWGLAYYARAEKFLSGPIRRRQSHIVYALAQNT